MDQLRFAALGSFNKPATPSSKKDTMAQLRSSLGGGFTSLPGNQTNASTRDGVTFGHNGGGFFAQA